MPEYIKIFCEKAFWAIVLIVYLIMIATVATGWYEDFYGTEYNDEEDE